MAKVKVLVSYKDLGLEKIFANARRLGLSSLRVGVVGPKASQPTADGRLTNAENAVIQQFGLHGAPGAAARDFLDGPYTSQRSLVSSVLRRVVGRVVRLQETPEQALDWAGYELEKVARDAIYQGIAPRNKPATIEKKGFDHALVDSLNLYDAISHQVMRTGGGALDAGSSVGDYETFEIGGS